MAVYDTPIELNKDYILPDETIGTAVSLTFSTFKGDTNISVGIMHVHPDGYMTVSQIHPELLIAIE